ncbi:MAG TPA: SIR2 family protein [Longimicrobium sp.]|nr:SIR2 family protein [Longimicrobium sp.]
MKTAEKRERRRGKYQAGFRNTGWSNNSNLQEVLDLRERLNKTAPFGRMTPFLGAACSAAGGDLEPRAPERDAILGRVKRLAEPVLAEKDPGALSDDEMSYALAVCRKYGAREAKKGDRAGGPSSRDADPILAAFQRALIRFAALAELLVGKALEQRPCGLVDMRNTWLVIPAEHHPRLRKELRNLLKRAIRLCQSEGTRSSRPSTLGVRGILEQLRVLALEVLPESDRLKPATAKMLGLGESKLRELYTPKFMRYPPKNAYQLAFSHVEWLAGLLWHTFRHNARFFPGSAELAFQLSLHSLKVPPLRAELGQAAEVTIAGTGEAMANRLNEWFEYYANNEAIRPGPLHIVLAAYLVHAAHSNRRRRGGPCEVWPVALTTNYDCELERALRCAREPFRVLVPGSARIEGQETDPKDVWICHFVRWAGDRDILETTVLEPAKMDRTLERNRLEALMQVPVIVKLHGTTGYTLPPKVTVKRKDGSSTTYTRVAYDLVLRESDYLASMARFPTDLLLQSIEEALFERKDRNDVKPLVCFLGHSLSDWNIRLRVYERVHRYHSWERRADVVAVNRRIDRYRAQIFAPLECEVAPMDLSTFVEGLREVDGIEELYKDFCEVV